MSKKRKQPSSDMQQPREAWKRAAYRLDMKNLLTFNAQHAPLPYDAWCISTGYDGADFSRGADIVASANWDKTSVVPDGRAFEPPRVINQKMYSPKSRQQRTNALASRHYENTEFPIYVCKQEDEIMCSFHALNNVLEQRLFSPTLYTQLLGELSDDKDVMPQIESDIVCYAARRLGIFLAPLCIPDSSEEMFKLLSSAPVERFLRECGSFFILATNAQTSSGHYCAARYVERLVPDPQSIVNDCWLLINSLAFEGTSHIKPYYKGTRDPDTGKKTHLIERLISDLQRSGESRVKLLLPLSPRIEQHDTPQFAAPEDDAHARVMLACCYKPATPGELSLAELYRLLLPPRDPQRMHPQSLCSTAHEAKHALRNACLHAATVGENLAHINRMAILALPLIDSLDELRLCVFVYMTTVWARDQWRDILDAKTEQPLMRKAFSHMIRHGPLLSAGNGVDVFAQRIEPLLRKILDAAHVELLSETPVLDVCTALFERGDEMLSAARAFGHCAAEHCYKEDVDDYIMSVNAFYENSDLQLDLLSFMIDHFVSIHPDDWTEPKALRRRPDHLDRLPKFHRIASAQRFDAL